MSVRLRWLVAIAVGALLTSAGLADAAPRPFGDARILARVPTPPGFPEGIAVFDGLVYVSGPATFDTAGGPPSKVLLYHAGTGILLRTFDTQGENLA